MAPCAKKKKKSISLFHPVTTLLDVLVRMLWQLEME